MNRPEFGFSLIEIVVTVSVLSLVAVFVVPVVGGVVDDAHVETARADLESIRSAYERFYADTKSWPGNGNGVWSRNDTTDTLGSNNYVLFTNTADLDGWNGPYLETSATGSNGSPAFTSVGNGEGLLDPWGFPYRLSGFAPGSIAEAPFGALVAYSRGPNNMLDTSDADLALGQPEADDIVVVITTKP